MFFCFVFHLDGCHALTLSIENVEPIKIFLLNRFDVLVTLALNVARSPTRCNNLVYNLFCWAFG